MIHHSKVFDELKGVVHPSPAREIDERAKQHHRLRPSIVP